MDFAVYSVGVYLFTEAYYFVLGPVQEANIAVFWCLLTLAFSLYPSSGVQGVGSGTRPSFPGPLTWLWDHPRCHRGMQASMISNSWLTLLSAE